MTEYETLHDKLEDIACMEKEHGLLGARIALKESSNPSTTEEVVDFVRDGTRKTVEVLERWETIPRAGENPPRN